MSSRLYTYRGDRMTAPALRGALCVAMLRTDGKCIRGRGSMLVRFMGESSPRVVLARLLRRADVEDNRSDLWRHMAGAHHEGLGTPDVWTIPGPLA